MTQAGARGPSGPPIHDDGVSPPGEWLPPGVVAVALRVDAHYRLEPVEASAVQAAVPRRRAEYATGRACARRALAAIGCASAVIPTTSDRAPVWPEGAVGSISHTDTLAVAAVARGSVVRGLGIDLEVAEPLERELWPRLAAPGDVLPGIRRGLAERVRFSWKEAAFKCWFVAGGGHILEFEDVTVLAGDGNRFTAFAPEPGPRVIHGRWALGAGHVWSVAWLL